MFKSASFEKRSFIIFLLKFIELFNLNFHYWSKLNLIIVKRWHHTNSTAIVSSIFNTFFNLQSVHDWSADVKNAHR